MTLVSSLAHRTLNREAGLWGEWTRVGGWCFLWCWLLACAITGALSSVTVDTVLYGVAGGSAPLLGSAALLMGTGVRTSVAVKSASA